MDISDRKCMVLAAIVALHTQSGEPVGSKRLLDSFNISSATIRNEMTALTEMGLLEQPHTSAGRVPTADGYRYYVDHLMRLYPLTAQERRSIDSEVAEMDTDPDKAAQQAAKALSELTGLAAVSNTVRGSNPHIVHYQLVRVGRYNIAVLAVSNAGAVKSRVCRTETELSDTQLRQVESALNAGATFVSYQDAGARTMRRVTDAAECEASAVLPFAYCALRLINEVAQVNVFAAGQQNLLRFSELDCCMRQLLELFSDSAFLTDTFARVTQPVAVCIGDDTKLYGLSQISMVLSRFHASGGMYGGLGVVGPVRINYQYIIPRIKYFCDSISTALTNT